MMTKVRAVIFDVYHTLLVAGPPPDNAAERWTEWWQKYLGDAPALSLAQFDEACRNVVAQDHARMKQEGARWPEVDWRSVAARAAEALSGLDREQLDAFLSGHAKLQRRTQAAPGAVAFLMQMRQRGILTGIASNAQHYTFGEMEAAGIHGGGFARDLCFWSFEHGFSKPDPAVFAWLTARLEERGIRPEEILMIGDRIDNDISPARAAGWQTWHFQGSWPGL